MTHVEINENEKEGRLLLAYLRSLSKKVVEVHTQPRIPNRKTIQAMREVREGKVKPVADVKKWFDELTS